MVALRSLGYGKKSIENKIIEEAEYLVSAIKVSQWKALLLFSLYINNTILNHLFFYYLCQTANEVYGTWKQVSLWNFLL